MKNFKFFVLVALVWGFAGLGSDIYGKSPDLIKDTNLSPMASVHPNLNERRVHDLSVAVEDGPILKLIVEESAREPNHEEKESVTDEPASPAVLESPLRNAELVTTSRITTKPIKASPRGRVVYETDCFSDCLGRNVNPDVVLQCAHDCANGNYVNCALCLGVATYIVVECWLSCNLLD